MQFQALRGSFHRPTNDPLSNMKKPKPFDRTELESKALGVLTRYALWFQFQNGMFSGPEVAGILLGGWQGYEQSKRTTLLPEETEP